MSPRQESPRRFTYFLTLWAFVENLLFSGLRAGWPALVYILKHENIYSTLCSESATVIAKNVTVNILQNREIASGDWSSSRGDNQSSLKGFHSVPIGADSIDNWAEFRNETGAGLRNQSLISCDEQDAVFNQCFTIATATMALSALLYGQLNYKFGIRAPRVLSVFVFVAGALCIAFINEDVPWLVFPGLILISSGGMALYLTNNQISYMYTGSSAGIVGFLCGALEASSFVQTVIKIAYEHGVSLMVSYLVLGALYLLTLISTFFLLPKDFISSPNTKVPDEKVDNCVQLHQLPGAASNDVKADVENLETKQGNDDINTNERMETSVKGKEIRTKEIFKCIFSKTFLLYIFWACVVQIILAMCLGTFNPWLEFVTSKNNEEVSRLTDVLLYSMLGSPVLSLMIGLSIDFLKKGDGIDDASSARRTLYTSSVSLGATSVLAVILCALFMTSRPQALIVTSVILVIFRTGLYSCGAAFLRIMYPTEFFGLLCGIMSLMVGSFSFLQYPLFLWVQLRDQAWMEVYGLLGLLGVVSLVQPIYLLWKSKHITADKS